MRVLVLPRYERMGASSRVRLYQYLPYLSKHGMEFSCAPFLTEEYLTGLYTGKGRRLRHILTAYARRMRTLRHARDYDLIWIEKEVFPWMPAWAEQRLTRQGIPYIVDYDDAVFHNYDQHRLGPVRRVLGPKIDQVMQKARMVIAGNAYLAERACAAGAGRVEVVPTVVDLDQYPLPPDSPDRPFTVGWIGTPITAPYLRAIASPLAEVCRNGDARLVAVGSGAIELEGVPTEIRAWSEQREAADIQDADVGIMPLPDESWERGKCGYKLIQFMACARPVVASPVGVNCQIVNAGVNGFLASAPAEWEQALRTLRDHAALRRQMGRMARQKVEQEYCLQVTAPKMLALFHEAAQQETSL